MANKTSFQLDITGAGAEILQNMASSVVKVAGDAIAARANSMAASISSNPPKFAVYTSVGTIKRGRRAIATVKANPLDARQSYVAHTALVRAKDAGRLN